ncbi:hypothetical protein WDU94_009719 [Cyamophila willieti]
MGVRKLQSFIESTTPTTVFRKVKILDLRKVYEKEHPGKPVELLVDLDCCIPHLFHEDVMEPKFGGDMKTVVVNAMKEFFLRFNEIGIRLITFVGNHKPQAKRQRWVQKRCEAVHTVNKLMDKIIKNPESKLEPDILNTYDLIPSELVRTVAAFIQFELKETVVHSFTENHIEIQTYARTHKSFGILSQDTDYIISNASCYYLSAANLCLCPKDITTYIYDSHGLAEYLHIHVNQLPLFATMMGNDIMVFDVMKCYQYETSKYGKGSAFVKNVAALCSLVKCNYKGFAFNWAHLYDLAKTVSNNRETYSPTKVYNLMMKSIDSYHSYNVEDELLIERVEQLEHPCDQWDVATLALTLYRQCFITSDVLMLICAKQVQMGTCIEILNDRRVRLIGDVLARLRKVLYGVVFNGKFLLVLVFIYITLPIPTHYCHLII